MGERVAYQERAYIPQGRDARESVSLLYQAEARGVVEEAAYCLDVCIEKGALSPVSGESAWGSILRKYASVSEVHMLIGALSGIKAFEAVPPVRDFQMIDAPYIGPDQKERYPLPKFIPLHIVPDLSRMQAAYKEFLASPYNKNLPERPGLIIESGYRSPYYQMGLFIRFLKSCGISGTFERIALPGISQHADYERCAVDFTSMGDSQGNKRTKNGREIDFSETLEGAWLIKNAPRFGFWTPYFPDPRDVSKTTGRDGILVEPWHFQYVGREAESLMRTNRIPELFQARSELLYTGG